MDFKIQYVVNRFRVKIIFASGSTIKYNDKRLHIVRFLRNIEYLSATYFQKVYVFESIRMFPFFNYFLNELNDIKVGKSTKIDLSYFACVIVVY